MTAERIFLEIDRTKADIADFIGAYKTEQTVSSYDDWNCRDVAAHILEWIVFSKNKIRAIARSKPFKEIENLDEFNRAAYQKNKNEPLNRIHSALLSELDDYKNAVSLYSDADLERKDFPTGFPFEMRRYMILDTVIHPVMHILYYALKTKRFDLFTAQCGRRHGAFLDFADGKLGVYSFAEYIENRAGFLSAVRELKSRYPNDGAVQAVLRANGLSGD
ncbi:MAG: hypothetical protein ACTTKL_10020 [Treponema sp.]